MASTGRHGGGGFRGGFRGRRHGGGGFRGGRHFVRRGGGFGWGGTWPWWGYSNWGGNSYWYQQQLARQLAYFQALQAAQLQQQVPAAEGQLQALETAIEELTRQLAVIQGQLSQTPATPQQGG